LNILQKIFFWNYERNTWQWDALCVLILIFIFLTPKGWFDNGERTARFLHQTPAATILLVTPEVVESARDNQELAQRLKVAYGRENLEVINVRKRLGADGKTVSYEVDIR
jgi:hypothetical protein